MNARHRQNSSTSNELQQRQAELDSLRARHAEVGAELQRLRREVTGFESSYHEVMGERIAQLESLEAEIARLEGRVVGEQPPQEECDGSFARERERQEEEVSEPWRRPARSAASERETMDLKVLYRKVAKTIHPDLVADGPARILRHELMLRANRAYAENDRRTLTEILANWRGSGEGIRDNAGDELALALRQIARERQEIRALAARIEELKGSYVWRFKRRVDANRTMGTDLLAEMGADMDLEIMRARKRLAALKGEKAREPLRRAAGRLRTVVFPAEAGWGTLYLREPGSSGYHGWQRLGAASGALAVEVDQALRLDIKDAAQAALEHLRQLGSHDLQALYLYDARDADLDHAAHLTGVEELYLSGGGLTDGALDRIASFSSLKRIYLYQTGITDSGLAKLLYLPALTGLTVSGNAITDGGLASFRLAAPKVNTVSFAWKR